MGLLLELQKKTKEIGYTFLDWGVFFDFRDEIINIDDAFFKNHEYEHDDEKGRRERKQYLLFVFVRCRAERPRPSFASNDFQTVLDANLRYVQTRSLRQTTLFHSLVSKTLATKKRSHEIVQFLEN